MKKQMLKAIGGASLAILMLATVAQVWVSAQDNDNELRRNGNERSLVGAWNVQVSILDCQTGTVLFGFPAMNTYNQGGTMQQTDLGDPSLLRLPGHGVWEHQTGRQYSAAFQFLNFNLNRTFAGRNVVRSTISLGRSGDRYTSTDTVEILDPNGNAINRGCATTTATRIQ